MTFGNVMLVSTNGDNSEEVVSDDAGIPDDINAVNTSRKEAEWYNVNGQKMSGKPTQNGVYVVNGKKYVVK